MHDSRSIITWALRLTIAGILLQTLFFKFSGAAESVYIFSRLGAEPWGRLASGLAELLASLLVLVPATSVLGAIFSMAIMAGAISSHLLVLGIEIQGDGGLLFGLALLVFCCSAALIGLRWADLTRWMRLAGLQTS